jgi:hypothetical protein
MATINSIQEGIGNSGLDLISRLISIGSDFSWLKTIGQIWTTIRKWLRSRSSDGMYEVLDYESILELKDRHGVSVRDKWCGKAKINGEVARKKKWAPFGTHFM